MKARTKRRRRAPLTTDERLALLDRATPAQIYAASRGCMNDFATRSDIDAAWFRLRRAVGR